MPTIGEVYDPIIEARSDPDEFERLLNAAGRAVFEANPDKCATVEDGIEAVINNLDYYVQYRSDDVVREVKARLGRSGTYRTLFGFGIPDHGEPDQAPGLRA